MHLFYSVVTANAYCSIALPIGARAGGWVSVSS